ncbi:MAG: IS3 family transposase [Solirubrobacterales bacterium]
MGVTERVAFARDLVGRGRKVAPVARVLQISRQAIYRTPKPRKPPQCRPPQGPIEEAIVETAKANPTDGYRMVWALTRRKLGIAVNRKRVLRVMREQRLIQRRRREPRRRRPGFFLVERPDQLWHLDMSSVWVAEHGWCYLNAAIDCCTREIVGWSLELRCRADEAIALVERAARAHAIVAGQLVLGTDNGSAFTARRFKAVLSGLGIAHRRGGYRDPESQAFIESWFGKLKVREVWRNEYETLEDARAAIGAYVDRYHHRPHSGLGYRTPKEVRQTWEDAQDEFDRLQNQAA